jgi:NTE family protein
MSRPSDHTDSLRDAAAPVQELPGERLEERPADRTALCLSGGGYRAMLFHLGALWRLAELGYLPRLDRISSVSGGSITAGVLARNWDALRFDDRGVAEGFEDAVVAPVRRLAGKTIDVVAILRGVLGPGSVGNAIAGAYDRRLFDGATLQDLPDRPRFVFNATNLGSGVLWRFSKPYMRDYRVGEVESPRVKLAVAVAASAAFPPVLSPVVLKLDESAYTPGSGLDLQHPPFTTKVVLTDGGVYDNLGLETAWKGHGTVLVSDGGGRIGGKRDVPHFWPLQLQRVVNVIDSQVRALRKRQVISGFESGLREGTYWGIWTDIAHYELADALPCPAKRTLVLARTATRLKAIDDTLQERLVNWGYAVCDAAMRKHVDPSLAAPSGFRYPAAGVG